MSYKPASNPFPGLRPFETSESYLFFGREGQAEELLQRLLRIRLLAVLGTSGSGKSSLVRAGLVPYLLKLPESHWRVATFRPGGNPINSLASALNKPDVIGKVAENEEDAIRDRMLLEVRLRRGSLGLIEVVRLARLPEDEKVLIVIDQFEEVFRCIDFSNNREDSAAFVKLILEASRQTELPIYIVLTMRSDFIGDCSQFHDLPEAVAAGLYLIPRMTRAERRAAIEEPVRIAGGSISRRLTNRLLNDAGEDPDQLPIMQHALMRTWENWNSGPPGLPMDLQNYLAIGGMTEALSKHANEAFDELDSEGKEIARRMFQALTEKGADNRKIRRATSVATLAEVVGVPIPDLIKVIDEFRKPGRSFLMPPSDVPLDNETSIDISHESLIRHWNRLAAWVDEEAESSTTYRRLRETAILHAANKAGLWNDPDLAIALAWKERTNPTEAWAERYGGQFKTAMDFLEASRAARDAELRRQRQFSQRVAMVAALVIIGLSGATLWAWHEKGLAQSSALAAQQARIDVSQVATLSRHLLSEAVQDESDDLDNTLDWAPPAWSAYLHREKAYALVDSGDFSSARTEIDLARKADPDYLPALVTSSDLFVDAGDADGAARDAGAYVQAVKTDAVGYGNLILAEAMRHNYSEAISKIDEALQNAHGPISSTESLISPDIQGLTHGFKLSVPDTDFLLALRYTKAFLFAMNGDQRFEAALDQADKSDRDYPYSRNAYLVALNWQWLIVRGQGLHDMQPAGSNKAIGAGSRDLTDYGAYAIEGALWDRVARTRPEYRGRALSSYAKFHAAYRNDPLDRYRGLAAWVDQQVGKTVSVAAPDNSVVDLAQGLAQQAEELKAPAGTRSINFVSAFTRLTNAIDLLTAKQNSKLGRRERDLLIDLLLRRAEWRLEGDEDEQDKGGAADDARRVIALNDKTPGAYRILAAAAFDDADRKANDEQALKLDPYNADALNDLAGLIQNDDPQRALLLLQKRRRQTQIWSDDYLQIAQLQMRLGNYPEALRSIESAIGSAPWRIDLYEQRREIEQKMGTMDQLKIELHLAQGLRAAAEYRNRTGDDGLALRLYMLAFLQAAAPQNMNDDGQFELQTIVRALSAFISTNYGRANAEQFWRTLSQNQLLTSTQRQTATREALRLTTGH